MMQMKAKRSSLSFASVILSHIRRQNITHIQALLFGKVCGRAKSSRAGIYKHLFRGGVARGKKTRKAVFFLSHCFNCCLLHRTHRTLFSLVTNTQRFRSWLCSHKNSMAKFWFRTKRTVVSVYACYEENIYALHQRRGPSRLLVSPFLLQYWALFEHIYAFEINPPSYVYVQPQVLKAAKVQRKKQELINRVLQKTFTPIKFQTNAYN